VAHVSVDTARAVLAARAGDLEAFGELVRGYQPMAIAYAFSLLRDLDLAQDAAQEAFVAAYLALDGLSEPLAFPGWLRAVVRSQCGRLTRRRRVPAVPLGEAVEVAAEGGAPGERTERREAGTHVLVALAGLRQAHREILTLHYVRDYSHQEIAAFLGIPATTVNARLHAARIALRERVLGLVRQALRAGATPQDFPERVARAIAENERLAGPAGALGRGIGRDVRSADVENLRRLGEADRFGVWPSLLPREPALAAGFRPPPGFRPHADPARCGCHRLAWPCPRCAAREGVDVAPPLPPID
jgi:RNA polymerase sigma factor (sigma-70 family)